MIETGVRLTSPNTVDLAYDTSLIAGGAPEGWGPTCYRYEIAPTVSNGGALLFVTAQNGDGDSPDDGAPFWTSGLRLEMDVIIERLPVVTPRGHSIAVAKAWSPVDFGDVDGLGGSPLVYRLYCYTYGTNSAKFLFVLDEDADEVAFGYPETDWIVVGRLYRHYILYDILNRRVVWKILDTVTNITTVRVNQALSATNPTDITSMILGSSGSSDARDVAWLVDRVYWEVNDKSRPLPYRPRVFSAGHAR